MKRRTKYVALDVHQATTVASVRREGGRVMVRTILPTEAPALLEFVGGMRGAVHDAFEEDTQAQWLHDLLAPRVERVVVCDRRGEPRRAARAIASMPICSPSCSGVVHCARCITAVHIVPPSRS